MDLPENKKAIWRRNKIFVRKIMLDKCERMCYFIFATKVRPPYSKGRVLPSSEGA
jgi:hypothetical protein